MDRIAHLVAAVKAARSYEWTEIGGRRALRIVSAEGTQMSVLTADEEAALSRALAAGPEVWTLEGLPACVLDATRGLATGVDEACGIHVTLIGAAIAVDPAPLTAAYRAIVRRREELVREVAARMAPLYNKTWRDGPQLSTGAIASRLQLTGVQLSVEEPADPVLWFSDGNLFAGHSVTARVDGSGAILDCTLAG